MYLRGLTTNNLQASIYNKVSASSKIGAQVNYDINEAKISTETAMRYRLNPASKLRLKLNNNGKLDFSLINFMNENFALGFNTGGNISNLLS